MSIVSPSGLMPYLRIRQFLTLLCLPCFLAGAVSRALAEGSNSPVSFSRDIASIFARKCVTCHGPDKSKGGFQLHTFEALMKPGESRKNPVVPKAPAQSKLFELITTRDPEDRMPQKDDPLPSAAIAKIKQWIDEGAVFDGPDPKMMLASLSLLGPQPAAPKRYARPVPISALAFSPDGSVLAAAGYHEITIWDSTNGVLQRRVGNVAERTASLAFAINGPLLASAGGTPGLYGEVKLFDPGDGSLVRTVATASDMMLAVVFSPDGSRLACAGTDNTVRMFEVASGRMLWRVEPHADWILSLAFRPDGSQLVSASRDKSVRILDARTGETDANYQGHTEAVFSAGFLGDGARLISAGRDKAIHVWESKEAKKVALSEAFDGEILKLIGDHTNVFSVALDRSARHHVLLGTKLELHRRFVGLADDPCSLAFHPPTQRLAAGGYDGNVEIWNATDGSLLLHFAAVPGLALPRGSP